MSATAPRMKSANVFSGGQRRSGFNKEYLPGYTGHVPSKNNLFGLTAGAINEAILQTDGKAWDLAGVTTAGALTSRIYSEGAPKNKPNKEVHGNWSKYAVNWVAGPTHEVWVQRVPNYTGHVKGLESENLFGMSYAKKTAKAISRRHPIGADLCPKNRFRSSQREDFKPSNFRRFGKKLYALIAVLQSKTRT